MSTHASIIFVGEESYINPDGKDVGIRLFKHHDGYPTDVLRILRDTIKRANRLIRKDEERGITYNPLKKPTPEMLAGLFIGENTSITGIGSRIEEIVRRPGDILSLKVGDRSGQTLMGRLLGDGDEWMYVVDTNARNVRVYGGGFTGLSGAEIIVRGTVNPESYAEHLIDRYQDRERRTIRNLIRSLGRLGWPVNPEEA